jgi:LAS superfamily LD-carboxypeptidase LdcB
LSLLVPRVYCRQERMKKDLLANLTLGHYLGVAVFALLIAAIAGLSWYGYTRITTLSHQVSDLSTELAQTADLLQARIADATTTLGQAIEKEQQSVNKQVRSITGTVSTLEKLSQTDPELLAKYSKIFFLSEHYAPARLVDIPATYKYSESKTQQIIPDVLPYLRKMLDAAKDDGVEIYVQSAYRSYDEQQAVKSSYTVTYGVGTANTFSADQGYSEHQLGTTVDFITTGTGGLLAGFDTKPAYAWLLKNAYKYGFALSYPKNNTYYIFEPWHWRFVGVKLATDLHKDGKQFYDLDQRTIDSYLVSVFD